MCWQGKSAAESLPKGLEPSSATDQRDTVWRNDFGYNTSADSQTIKYQLLQMKILMITYKSILLMAFVPNESLGRLIRDLEEKGILRSNKRPGLIVFLPL